VLTGLPEQSSTSTYIIQYHQLVRPSAVMVTNGEEDAVTAHDGNQLLSEEQKEYSADGREVEVVHLEQEAKFEGRALAHNLPPTKDDNVVCEENGGACLERRHRRLAGHESEVLRLVAHGRFIALLEDGPQLQAKRAVECRHAVLYPFRCLHCGWRGAGSGGLL